MRRAPLVERRSAQGSPVTIGDCTITPVAHSLVARWPGGGYVRSGPEAVLVERQGKTERIPIANVNDRILWAIRAGAVALIAVWTAKDRMRRTEND